MPPGTHVPQNIAFTIAVKRKTTTPGGEDQNPQAKQWRRAATTPPFKCLGETHLVVIMPVLVCLLGLPLTFGSLDLAYARSLNTFDVMDALEATVNVYDSFCLSAETARTAYRFFGLRKRQRRRETACPRAHNILCRAS